MSTFVPVCEFSRVHRDIYVNTSFGKLGTKAQENIKQRLSAKIKSIITFITEGGKDNITVNYIWTCTILPTHFSIEIVMMVHGTSRINHTNHLLVEMFDLCEWLERDHAYFALRWNSILKTGILALNRSIMHHMMQHFLPSSSSNPITAGVPFPAVESLFALSAELVLGSRNLGRYAFMSIPSLSKNNM